MVMEATKKAARSRLDLQQLWYAPDRRLRHKSTVQDALRIADWVAAGQGLETKPDEKALFVALHTCTYRAARPARGKPTDGTERQQWARRWRLLRDYIVEKNMGLVYSMLRRFALWKCDEDDLLSDALLGLTRAVGRFNPWRGYRFSTYACNVIARAVMRRGKQEGHRRQLFPVQHEVSFERPVPTFDSQTELYVERLSRVLHQNLGELTDLESRILAQRFPAAQQPRLTFQEIGDAVGLSKERVRQIQKVALDKLRQVLAEDPLLQ